jgi:hypothetical protein
MTNVNLHAMLTLKQRARELTARSASDPDEAHEITGVYERLREQARDLNSRAWPEDQTFDRDVPPLTSTASLRRLPRTMSRSQPLIDAVASGQRASILAGQLAAWAEGHQEAFELEAKLKIEAEAKAKVAAAEAAKPTVGFARSLQDDDAISVQTARNRQ